MRRWQCRADDFIAAYAMLMPAAAALLRHIRYMMRYAILPFRRLMLRLRFSRMPCQRRALRCAAYYAAAAADDASATP